MRSEQTRSTLTRPLAASLIFWASGLACAAEAPTVSNDTTSSVGANAMVIRDTSLYGRQLQQIRVNNAQAAESYGSIENIYGMKSDYLFRNKVVVQSLDWDSVEAAIDSIPGAAFGQILGNQGRFRVVEVSNVGDALDLQELLRKNPAVISAEIDSGKLPNYNRIERFTNARRAFAAANNTNPLGSYSEDQTPIGIQPVEGLVDPQVLGSFQWNFSNDGLAAPMAGDWAGFDNNILESIYSTQLITGAGVVVGVSSFGTNLHLDVDHSELVNAGVREGGYLHDLSMPSDPAMADDNTLTGLAGIVAAERNAAGIDFQGVAPGAGVVSFYNGPTALDEYNGFLWKLADVDIKVHNMFAQYDSPDAGLNQGRGRDFVTDAFKNSLKFGRRGKGTIHIFDTGAGFNLLPDPYNTYITSLPANQIFPAEPWDAVALNPNIVGVTISNSFISLRNGEHGALPDPMTTPIFRNTAEDDYFLESLYVGGQTHMYPIANDPRTLVINTISEDSNIDSTAAVGPGVFASVFAGSSNEIFSLNRAVSGRGVVTTGSPNVLFEMPASLFINPIDIVNSTATGAATAGGIVALMLEANPRLRVRDIQHILFESIQESTKPPAIKWPNFSTARSYFFPGGGLGLSFWQLNSALYNNEDAVPPVVNQTVRHSDQYGFGVIDAALAVEKAATWGRLKPLILLDTGVVGDVNLANTEPVEDPRVPVAIVDATWSDSIPADEFGNVGMVSLIPSATVDQQIRFCVRENIKIESIVIELTIEGQGSNDLFITLTSPQGTVSNLSYPTTMNFSGQTTDALDDDESDSIYDSGAFNGTNYAYYQHPFLTYKHWGELSGGSWAIDFGDYGVDEAHEEGAEPGDPMAMPAEPGADMEVFLGDIGVPGSTIRSEKSVAAFRVRIYGTETSADPFFGCDPGATSCPGDINADGIIDTADFLLFITWYQVGDIRADMNNDGAIDFADILAFRAIFVPGLCTTNTGGNVIGGRPRPGTNNVDDNNPTTRPI